MQEPFTASHMHRHSVMVRVVYSHGYDLGSVFGQVCNLTKVYFIEPIQLDDNCENSTFCNRIWKL